MPAPLRRPCYLVRHGQSEWNLRELTQGQAMAPALTTLGREQAAAAAALISADLAGGAVRVVRTSDLTRARQTADIVAERLRAAVVPDPRLREHDVGSLEGLPYAEAWAALDDHDWHDPHLPIAGGESSHQVGSRMASALAAAFADAVAEGADGVTVLVSHADAIRALLAHLAGSSPAEAPWVVVPNGSVLRFDGDAVTRLGPESD